MKVWFFILILILILILFSFVKSFLGFLWWFILFYFILMFLSFKAAWESWVSLDSFIIWSCREIDCFYLPTPPLTFCFFFSKVWLLLRSLKSSRLFFRKNAHEWHTTKIKMSNRVYLVLLFIRLNWAESFLFYY